VFDVREGWEPLCSFLQLPVPNCPFPNVNDSASLKKTFNVIRWMCWGFLLAVPLLLACLLPRCDTMVETIVCSMLVVGLFPAMGWLVNSQVMAVLCRTPPILQYHLAQMPP